MSFSIPVSFVDQFKANVILLSQQKTALLPATCRLETVTGQTMYVERVSATSAQLMTTRHGDTPLISTPHSRRRLTMLDYNWADLIDSQDRLKMLIDPQSIYAQNAIMAFNRQKDDTIIAALGGIAFGGVAGETQIPVFAVGESRCVSCTGTVEPPGTDCQAGTETGLTIAKLLTCKQLLDQADIDKDRQRYFITNPANIATLLNTTEVKSSDYNTVKALAQGDIDTFMGFKFIMSNRLPVGNDPGSTVCYAWAQDAVVFAVSEEPIVRITERADKNYAVQVYVEMSIGATRVEGPAVVKIELKTTG